MRHLNLTFLEQPKITSKVDPIEKVLNEIGQGIYEYAKGYFNYIVTTTSNENVVSDASLYIFVPEIGYDYKILTVSYENATDVKVSFYTLKTKQTAEEIVNIENGLEQLYAKVDAYITSSLANEIFKFLVEQVNLKREHKDEEIEP